MAVSGSKSVAGRGFGGLDQFERRGNADDISYCIAGSRPYALEFSNDVDVICLLLGDIATETKFEDDGPRDLVFAGQSSAFHPRGGNVRVRADVVRHGFIAFGYASSFQNAFDDAELGRARRAGSRNNIRTRSIASLSRGALRRLRGGDRLEPFEVQSLACLVYKETIGFLGRPRPRRARGLSDREFAAVLAYIDAELGGEMTCAGLAAAAGVPLRVVFEGMKQRTGLSPYRYVIERRIARARSLLTGSDLRISEIALACGFSSQQHLTSTLSSRLGHTPQRIRAAS